MACLPFVRVCVLFFCGSPLCAHLLTPTDDGRKSRRFRPPAAAAVRFGHWAMEYDTGIIFLQHYMSHVSMCVCVDAAAQFRACRAVLTRCLNVLYLSVRARAACSLACHAPARQVKVFERIFSPLFITD